MGLGRGQIGVLTTHLLDRPAVGQVVHHDLGDAGVSLLRTLKSAVDPQGIMNPGNLIPDA